MKIKHGFSKCCWGVAFTALAAVVLFEIFFIYEMMVHDPSVNEIDHHFMTVFLEKYEWGVFMRPFILLFLIVLFVFAIRQGTRKYNKSQKNHDNALLKNDLLKRRLSAIELAVDGILIIESDGRLQYMNSCFRNLFNIGEEDVDFFVGRHWKALFSGDLQQTVVSAAMNAMEHEDSWQGEYCFDDRYIEVIVKSLPESGFVITHRDITGRKNDEQHYKKLESQLTQSKKMEAIGRLASGVAHDFNNILAAMSGYTEFLIEDLENQPKEQKFAHKVMTSINQAKDLVDKILTFSRKNEALVERMNIVDLVQDSIDMLSASSRGGVEVYFDSDLSQPDIFANKVQISQAVMNLCVNAIDAMKNVHGVMRVTLASAEKQELDRLGMLVNELPHDIETTSFIIHDGEQEGQCWGAFGIAVKDKDYICLTVSDTGDGMTRDVLEQAFDPFFTTKISSSGTGLGLSTIQGVVALHRGCMVVETIHEVGSKFKLYLPVGEASILPIAGAQPTHQSSKDVSILLVEDQDRVREVTHHMIERLGYKVQSCASGQSAVALLDKKKASGETYDLVITDHVMPKMTGLELIEQCQDKYPNLPFIVLTGYKKEGLAEEFQRYDSVKAIIKKPATKRDLENKILEACGGQGANVKSIVANRKKAS